MIRQRFSLVLVTVLGCSGRTDSLATRPDAGHADASASDSMPSDGEPTDAGGLPSPQLLVPAALGTVFDFAYTQDALYPILSTNGTVAKLVYCPGQICTADSPVIGDSAVDGVEVVGSHIYWIAVTYRQDGTAAPVLMQANLDGSDPIVRYTPPYLSTDPLAPFLTPPMIADGEHLYFSSTDPTTTNYAVAAIDTTSDTSPPVLAYTVSDQSQFFDWSFDIKNGVLALWHTSVTPPGPVTITTLATNSMATLGSWTSVAKLAFGATGVFAVARGPSSAPYLGACTFAGSACAATGPADYGASVGDVGDGLAAADDHAYFSFYDDATNRATIGSCALADAAAGSCTPQIIVAAPAAGLAYPIRMRADSSAVYVATQSSTHNGVDGVWRIPLVLALQ